MTRARLVDLLERIAGQRVLVVGDAMLDEYIWGDATRVSQEAPVLVVRSHHTTHIPGGAANVLCGLRALGAPAGLVAVAGRDHRAEILAELLARQGAEPVDLIVDESRQTTVKTRVVAQGQQVLRLDHETTSPLAEPIADRLLARLAEALSDGGSVLLSDYDKGVLHGETIPRALELARARGAAVGVNAKPRWAAQYTAVDLLTVNRAEAGALTSLDVTDPASAAAAAELLRERLRPRLTLVTLGPDGAVFAAGEQPVERVPAVPVSVADPSGAGDTTIAAAHLALAAGAAPREAVELAMLAAGVVVRKLGVAVAAPAELLALSDAAGAGE